jgi:hypothetical protein
MLLFSWALLRRVSPFCLMTCDFVERRKSICTFEGCDAFVVLLEKGEGGRGKVEVMLASSPWRVQSPCARRLPERGRAVGTAGGHVLEARSKFSNNDGGSASGPSHFSARWLRMRLVCVSSRDAACRPRSERRAVWSLADCRAISRKELAT